eukprot:TRINITY_DN23722_c0_g2_i1.p1 TRINITY_DN23722_c0_g2~~TRINITY_DN23722_c0_g2_i1.p1  ORF type:complete len:217 (+),score=13.79 TRINITY_DN23722_c0_g2_i1:165-815(+)
MPFVVCKSDWQLSFTLAIAFFILNVDCHLMRAEDNSLTVVRTSTRAVRVSAKVLRPSHVDNLVGSMDAEVLDLPIFASDTRMKAAITQAISEVINEDAQIDASIVVNSDLYSSEIEDRSLNVNDNDEVNGSSMLNNERNLSLGRAVVEFQIKAPGIMDKFDSILNLMRQAAFVDVIGFKYRALISGHLGSGRSAEFTPRACQCRPRCTKQNSRARA